MDHMELGQQNQIARLKQDIQTNTEELKRVESVLAETDASRKQEFQSKANTYIQSGKQIDEEGIYQERLKLIPKSEVIVAELEKTLSDGYKKAGKQKCEREEWENDIRKQIDAAKNVENSRNIQNRFVNEYINSRENTKKELIGLQSQNSDKQAEQAPAEGQALIDSQMNKLKAYMSLMQKTVSERNIDYVKIVGITPKEKTQEAERIRNVTELMTLLTEKKEKVDESGEKTMVFKEKTDFNIKDVISKYKALNIKDSGYVMEQFEKGAEELSEAGITMILSSCIRELNRHVNKYGRNLPDTEVGKLYAVGGQTELITNNMLVSDEYRNCLHTVNEGRKIKVEQNIELQSFNVGLILDTRMTFIERGSTDKSAAVPANWRLIEYKDEFLKQLGNKIETLTDTEFPETILAANDRLLINDAAIDQSLIEMSKKDEYKLLKSDAVRRKAKADLVEALGNRLFTDEFANVVTDKDKVDKALEKEIKVLASFEEEVKDDLYGAEGSLIKLEGDLRSVFTRSGLTSDSRIEFEALLRNSAVVDSIVSADETEKNRLLEYYANNYRSNQYLLKQWISGHAPTCDKLYYETFISYKGEMLFSNSMPAIIRVLDGFHRQLPAYSQNLFSLINKAEKERLAAGGETAEEQEKTSDKYSNINRLEGELLFGWTVFEDCFKDCRTDCVKAFRSLAKKGQFKSYGLKENCTDEDINNLLPAVIEQIAADLSMKIAANLEQWTLCPSVELLESMMTMNSDEFETEVHKKLELQEAEKQLQEKGFSSELLGTDYRKKRITYVYSEQTSTTNRFANLQARGLRRSCRMGEFRKWKNTLLRENGLDGIKQWQLFLEKSAGLQDGKFDFSAVSQKLKTEHGKHDLLGKVNSVVSEGILQELLLCNQEQFLLENRADALQKDGSGEYAKKTQADAVRVATRERQFWAKVSEAFEDGTAIPEGVFELLDKVQYQFSEETEEADWERRLGEISKHIVALKSGTAPEKDVQAEFMAKQREERFRWVKEKQGDIFDKIKPYLMQNKEILSVFSAGKESSFIELYNKLEENVFPAVKLLYGTYAYSSDEFYQILEACKGDIFDVSGHREISEWETLFTDTHDKIFSSDFGNAVKEKIDAIIAGDKISGVKCENLRRYSDLILQRVNYDSLLNKAKFADLMKKYSNQVLANDAAFNEFMEKKFASPENSDKIIRSAAIRVSVYMSVRNLFLDSTIDEAVFEKAWTEIVSREAATISDTEEAEIRMLERRRKFREVVNGKEKGKELFEQRRKEQLPARKLLGKGVSPSVAAALAKQGKTGDALVPSEKVFEKCLKRIDTIYADESETVRDQLKQLYLVSDKYREFLDSFRIGSKLEKGSVTDDTKHQLDRVRAEVDRVLSNSFRMKDGASKEMALKQLMGMCIRDFSAIEAAEEEQEIQIFVYEKMVEYRDKLACMTDFNVLAKNIADTPILQEEYDRVKVRLSYEMYSESKEDYTAHVKSELAYFNKACALGAELKKYTNDNTGLLTGLFDYFYHYLGEPGELDVDKINEEAGRLVSDKVVAEYLADSKSFLGSVNNKSLKAEEKKVASAVDRERFMDCIGRVAEKDQLSRLTAFSNEDWIVLAMLLSEPQLFGESASTIGMDLVSGVAKDKYMLKVAQRVMSFYCADNTIPSDFAPNYEKALYALSGEAMNAEKVENKDLLEKAISFIDISKQYRELAAIKENKSGGMDPMTSLEAKKVDSKYYVQPESTTDLLDRLCEIAVTDKKSSLQKRLEGLKGDSYSQALLVMVLQNRSVVDYSTSVSRFDRASGVKSAFVDEDGREELKALMGGQISGQFTITGEMLDMAMKQSVSFKWDEGSAKFATKDRRKTILDVEMLNNALDFVEELAELDMKRQLVKTAATPFMIKKSGNVKAIEALKQAETAGVIDKTEDYDTDEVKEDIKAEHPEMIASYVEKLIQSEAEKDGKMTLLAGYLSLTEKEKDLFLHAVSHRDILDISKEDIWLNRFGMKDRDYVNFAERNETIDSFFKGAVAAPDYTQVLYGLLSAQINDTADPAKILNLREAEKAKNMSSRSSAIDWKLFARGLQLVQRSKNEKRLTDEQQALNRTFTDQLEEGVMDADMSMMRRNIHNAGTRYTRFLGRRTADELLDFVPDYMKFTARFLLPRKVQDKISELKPFEQEEEDGWALNLDLISNVSKIGGEVQNYFSEDPHTKAVIKAVGPKLIGESKFDKLGSIIDTTGDICGYVENGMDILKGGIHIGQLVMAGKTEVSEQERSDFEEQLKQIPKYQEREFVKQASDANARNIQLGKIEAIDRQIDTILNATAELLSNVAEDSIHDILGPILVKEVAHTINFIRGYLRDLSNIATFFNVDEELKEYRKILIEKGTPADKIPWSDDSFIAKKLSVFCEIKGYENLTELSEVVGMNITESILFSASKYYNGTLKEKLVAKTIMKTLGVESEIDSLSADSAGKLYDALMGEER